MPNITDANVIKFSNETVRVGADALSRCYYKGNLAKQMYDGAGGGAGALAVTGVLNQIRAAADQWLYTFGFTFERESEWFLKGSTGFIGNTADPIIDGSPSDGRPQALSAKCVAVLARFTEYVNAVRSATFSFSDAARNSLAKYNMILAASNRGTILLSVADAQNFVDLTALLKTNYEATGLTNLNSLLTMAVNPGTNGN